MRKFDFTINLHGATIVVASDRLTTASLHLPEIDEQVAALKADLDRVAGEMKAAIVAQGKQPLGLNGRDT